RVQSPELTRYKSQMVMSLRVSELQVLLGYAGRNKHGRKHELLTMALHLLKAGCSPAVQMKIKELYCRRFPTKMGSPSELVLPGPHYPASGGGGTAALPAGLSQLAYEGHGHGGVPSPAALLPISLLGPGKHELSGLAHHLPTSATLHPVHPDVKLQRLPFYDMLDELIKPTSLGKGVCGWLVSVAGRCLWLAGVCGWLVSVAGWCLWFCLSETSCPQEDHFPPNLCVKVNGKPCNLPGYLPPTKNGVEPKRPSRPINITSVVRLSTTVPNTIVVSWTSEVGRSYSMAVYLVKQQSSTVLLQRLRSKGIRNPDHSRALIKEKLTADPDSEIATTSLRVSLLCPLGKMRLMIPCRALTCSHLQCFDATLYIQMNEKKPTWVCPVCDKKAPYEHLIIDGLFMEILNSCVDCDEIQFKEDGYWAPMRTKKEVQEVSSASYSNGLEGLHRSAVGEQRSSSSHNGGSSRMKVEVIDLTLDSSSEDDDDDQPPLKRPCPSLSPTSPPIVNKGVLNLHHQVSPVSRTPSMPSVDTSYIPPVPPLIQDYRPYYHAPNQLTDLNFFSFLQGDNHQHYNMVMAAAAAASASDDHELLLNHFRPYTTSSSSSSQLFLDQSGAPSSGSLAPVNGGDGGNSSGGSSSSLVSSSSLRDTHSTHSHTHPTHSHTHPTHSHTHPTHSHPGVGGRSSADVAAAALYGAVPDVISLD
uniref:Protein inhibitor of activated STAT 1 n=1 Tax=Oncorhynchus kisutch TaxID=8019 RepID=A0A8C7JNN4_ONCKI